MTFSRRDFLARSLAASALAFAPFERLAAAVRFRSEPFQLGVASGEPAADGFVLWTRVAPEPFEPGQLGTTVFELEWEVATDRDFGRIAASGTAFARPHLAHAVHVEVGGLAPASEYFYRFRLGRYESPVGRAVTAPAAGAPAESLRFGISSCAHYEQGFFAAYRHMAADGLDLMLALGDYIYEGSWGARRVRLFDVFDAVTLDDYRRRYCQYRTDPDLQAAHAACPWLVTWDDHEVANDYVGFTSEHELCGGEQVRESFPARRAAAYKAWFEHMPVRPSRLLPGGAIRLWGTVDWGSLARFYLLDTRQFRSPQACNPPPTEMRCDSVAGRKLRPGGTGGGGRVDPAEPACKAALEDPSRTFLGEEQERWLDGAFGDSRARWNLLAQAVMFAPLIEGSRESPRVRTDNWSGYPAARERLLGSLARHRTPAASSRQPSSWPPRSPRRRRISPPSSRSTRAWSTRTASTAATSASTSLLSGCARTSWASPTCAIPAAAGRHSRASNWSPATRGRGVSEPARGASRFGGEPLTSPRSTRPEPRPWKTSASRRASRASCTCCCSCTGSAAMPACSTRAASSSTRNSRATPA